MIISLYEHGHITQNEVFHVSFILSQDLKLMIFMCRYYPPLNYNLLYNLIARFLYCLFGDNSKRALQAVFYVRGIWIEAAESVCFNDFLNMSE